MSKAADLQESVIIYVQVIQLKGKCQTNARQQLKIFEGIEGDAGKAHRETTLLLPV